MRALVLVFLLSPLLCWSHPPVWSRTGHRVVGEVAQEHLSRKAQKAIARLLGGEGLAEVSNFADDIKSDTAYRKFSPWHYVNFPLDKAYKDVPPSPYGDIVAGIEHCARVLKDPNSPRSEQVFYLKMLVHFIGDLHQPLHVGREEDRGGNSIQFQYFNEGTNLHRLWDSNLIDDYGMSYTELAQTLPRLSRSQVRAIQAGTVYDWVEEVQEVTKEVYGSVQVGEHVSYRYRYDWWDTVESQLLRGGLRLAALLNSIYD